MSRLNKKWFLLSKQVFRCLVLVMLICLAPLFHLFTQLPKEVFIGLEFSLMSAFLFQKLFDKTKRTPVAALLPVGLLWLTPFSSLLVVFLIIAIKLPLLFHEIQRLRWLGYRLLAPTPVRIVCSVGIAAVLFHLLACGWVELNQFSEDTPLSSYIKALYWTVASLTTVGYGDIVPNSNASRLYAMLVMIGGVAFYGFVIGEISRLFFQSREKQQAKKQKLQNLSCLVDEHSLPEELQSNLFYFFDRQFAENTSEDEQKILAELPDHLRREVELYMNMNCLRRTDLFSTAPETTLKDVALRFEKTYFKPNQVIMKEGDVGQKMYILLHGNVSVLSGDKQIAQIHSGDCFGELSLIDDRPRGASIYAQTFCLAYALAKDDFQELLQNHEDLRFQVQKLYELRQKVS